MNSTILRRQIIGNSITILQNNSPAKSPPTKHLTGSDQWHGIHTVTLLRRNALAEVFLCYFLMFFVVLTRAHGDEPVAVLQRIRVAADKQHFVFQNTNQRFVPWGVNYDHDENGRLLEDYWFEEWHKVEEDFREIKALGANVVRIHLQFGKFVPEPNRVEERSLGQLRRLLQLAEREGLYLDITGLGCYHKQDVPPWYDALEEAHRWEAQALFWKAVAQVGSKSVAIFCYDLMNEPVVSGGKRMDWLGPPLGDKHFVQFISLDPGTRPRTEVAKSWVDYLVNVVRQQDSEALVTVGLVPWSLERPGLTSGFVPEKTCQSLDFIAVHLYPNKGQLEDALNTLRGFDMGKPVVVEEVFPLRCSAVELEDFLRRSRPHAAGWISFYWGCTAHEYRQQNSLVAAIMADWLDRFQRLGKEFTSP